MITMSARVVYDHMPRFGSQAQITTKAAAGVFADKLLAGMKARAPVRTGALRDGLYVNQVSGMAAYHVGIGSRMDYWPYVEYGTRFVSARPFIGPAVNENMPEFRATMAASLVAATLALAGPAVVG